MANYPVPYQNNWGYSGVGQQMYPQYQQSMAQMPGQQMQQTQPCTHGLIWVDGEVGAKAYQLPAGIPANQPIALWDTNDTVIYLKSINAMGMPNPLQKAHYVLDGAKSGERTQGYSGDAKPDMSEYVRKEDLDRMKQDLIDTIGQMNTSGGVKRTTAKGE
jgi:hypothetical protein